MKKKAKRIISLCLAAVILATSVGVAPPAEGAVKIMSSMGITGGEETATPSDASHSVEKATPSTATPSEGTATPSQAEKTFIRLEPEEVPEYYSRASRDGKKFWKFEDRYGDINYRDYGYIQGDVEFPQWYETDSSGDAEESINLDEEYYSLAPFIYQSVAPDKTVWSELSWKLFYNSDGIEACTRQKVSGFENWDYSNYVIWNIEIEGEEDLADLGYYFYGVEVNRDNGEQTPDWYYADEAGNIRRMQLPLMVRALAAVKEFEDIEFTFYRNLYPGDTSQSTQKYTSSSYSLSSSVTLPTPSTTTGYTDYVFLGWNIPSIGNGGYTTGDTTGTGNYSVCRVMNSSMKIESLNKIANVLNEHLIFAMWRKSDEKSLLFINNYGKKTYYDNKTDEEFGLWSVDYVQNGKTGDSFDLNHEAYKPLGLDSSDHENETFMGWFTGMDGTGQKVDTFDFSKDLRVYSYFAPDSEYHTVTFLDYAGNIVDEQQVSHGADAVLPESKGIQIPAEEGYDFTGWSGSYTNVKGDRTVTANYKELPDITIEYRNKSGGVLLDTFVIKAKSALTPLEIDPDSLPQPNTGYEYSGNWIWSDSYTNNRFYGDFNCVETIGSRAYTSSTIVFWPEQVGKVYKVRLHSNEEQDITLEYEVQYAGLLYLPDVIDSSVFPGGVVKIRAGYTNLGWSESSTSTTADASYYMKTYDLDLYQVWKQNKYVLSFDGGISGETFYLPNVNRTYNQPLGELPVISSKGRDFLGWYMSGASTPVTSESLMPDSDLMLTAKWQEFMTTMNFDGNYENSPDISSLTMYIASKTTSQIYSAIYSKTKPTRKGYTFYAWNTQADGKGKSFYSSTGTYLPEDKEVTLYAIWTPVKVFVGLYENKSSSDTDKVATPYVDYGTLLGNPAVPTNPGKIFTGWYTARTGGQQINETSPVDYGRTTTSGSSTYYYWDLYAHWANESNTVVFKDWDGTILSTQTVIYEESAIPPAEPEREGYRFTGWDKSYENIQEDTTLTAQYEISSRKLFLDGNGGTLSGDPSIETDALPGESIDQVLTDGQTNASRKYYTFDGWYTAPSGGSKYSESGNQMPNTDLTLYAHWIRSSSEVTYKNWDGATIATQEVAIGAEAVPPTVPERPGYTFTGWDKSTTNIQDHTIITAQYIINSHKLTLAGNGGTVDGAATKEQDFDYQESFDQALADGKEKTTRKYYTFDGWYTAPSGGSKYSKSGNQMPDEDVTVYAHWVRSFSLVTYKDWTGATIDSQEVAIGADAVPPSVPERPGYTFTGWDKALTNIQDHTIITAQYIINSHKLTLNGNGGTIDGAATKEQDFDYQESFDQVLADGKEAAARKYYTFDGWYTAPSGGSKYANTGNQMPDTDLTVYAHWVRRQFLQRYRKGPDILLPAGIKI